ncbi:hypothetical protein RvY_17942 [Ramazzottius varieornatus]|uniref:Spatacsin C-terminal domain-containing protein n=1 Tax=Ramazzottius varieornatus TaxID=947166 RepID=A0A1D1W4N2_RAMVA|nr:hypothetical protein RvY_17942 [Ramazzottius varieornatus]
MEDIRQARLSFRLPLDVPRCSIYFSPSPRTFVKASAIPPPPPSLLVLLPSRQGQLFQATLSARSLLPVHTNVQAVLWLTSSRFLILDRLSHDLLLYRVIREADTRFVCTFHFAFSSFVTLLFQHGLMVKLEDALELVKFHSGSSCLDMVVRREYFVQLAVDERGKSMQVLACLRLGDGLTKGSFNGQDLTLLYLPEKLTACVMAATQFGCFIKLPLRKTGIFMTGRKKETSIALAGLTPDCRWLILLTTKPLAICKVDVQRDVLKMNENPSNVFQHLHMSRLYDARLRSSTTKSSLRRPSNVGTSSKPRYNAVWEQEAADVVSKNNALQNSFEFFQPVDEDGEKRGKDDGSWNEVVVPEEYEEFLPKVLHCTNSEVYVVASRDGVSRHLLLGVKRLLGDEEPFWMVFEEDCHIHFPLTSSYPVTLVYFFSVTVIAANEQQGFQRELAHAAAPDPWHDLEALDIMEMVLQQHYQQPSKDYVEKAVEYLQRRYPDIEEFKEVDYPEKAASAIARKYLTSRNYTQASQVLYWVTQPVLPLLEQIYLETTDSPLRFWLRASLTQHHGESRALKEMEQSFEYLTLLEESIGEDDRASWNLVQVSGWSNEEKRRKLLTAALKKGNANLVDRYSTEEELWLHLVESVEVGVTEGRLLRWVSGTDHEDITHRRIPESFCEKALTDFHDVDLRDAVLNAFARRAVYSQHELQDWRTFLIRTMKAFKEAHLTTALQKLPPSLRTQLVRFASEYRLTPVVLELFRDDEVDAGLREKYGWLGSFLELRGAVFVDGKPDGALASWCRESLGDIYGVPSGEAIVVELMEKGDSVNVWDLLGAIILFQKQWPAERLETGSEVPKALLNLQKHLQRFPPFYQALFPTDSSNDRKTQNRVSIYSALQKTTSCHYEVNKLFGWQSNQTLNTLYRLPEIPTFSGQALQKRHGYKKEADFVYYLKNARPAFAYWSFVSHLTANSGVGNQKEEVVAARDMAFYLTMAFITHEAVTKACVAFAEMLGSESLPLRILLQMAHHMKTSQKTLYGEASTQSAFMELFKYGGEVAGSFLQAWLQRLSEGPVRGWEEMLRQRLLVHQFIQLFSLKFDLNDIVLNEGPRKNDWLSFLLLCDLFQYPVSQVTAVLPQVFSHPHLQHNLRCILQIVKNAKHVGGLSDGGPGEANKEQRNVRSSLYQRIGMKAAAAMAAWDRTTSSASEDERAGAVKKRDRNMMEAPPTSMIAALSNSLHRSLLSWKTLLNISTALSSPVYAMMAASEPGAHHVSVLAVLLYTSLSLDKRRRFQLSARLPPPYEMADFHWTLHQHVEPLGLLFVPDELPRLTIAFRLVAPYTVIHHLVTLASEVHHRADTSTITGSLRKVLAMVKTRLRSSPSKDDNDSSNESMAEGEASLESAQWGTSYGLRVLALMMSVLKKRNARQWRQALLLIKESGLLRFVKGEEEGERGGGKEGVVRCMMMDMVEMSPSSSQSDVSRLDELKSLLQDFQRSPLWQSPAFRMEVWQSISRRIHIELRQEQSVSQVVKLLDGALEFATSQSTLLEQCLLTHILCKLDDSDTRFYQAWLRKLAYGKSQSELGHPVKQWMEELSVDEKQEKSPTNIQTELLQLISTQPVENTSPAETSTDVGANLLEDTVSELLKQGKLTFALRLSRVFGHHSSDIDLLCWGLTVALQDRLPEGSSNTWPLVLRHVENKEVKRSQSMTEPRTTLVDLRRASSVRSEEDGPVMQCLKKAVSVAQAARSAMEAVLDFYSLSKLLSVPFDNVLRFDALQIVDGLLSRPNILQSPDNLSLARRCLSIAAQHNATFSLSAIIGQHIVSTARKLVTERSSDVTKSTASTLADTLRPYWSLALDQSSLVINLLDTVHRAISSQNNPEVFSSVEILIIANQIINETSHKPDMTMSGHTRVTTVPQLIGRLLEVAKSVSKSIASTGQFPLLIRLLQGVGRYSDMTFIFHQIKQACQMELLFSRHVEKEVKLKTAILSYLQRYQPDDQEAFEMLAAAYSMHRDIAEMYWGTAQDKLALFKHRPITETKETQTELRAIIQYMMDALSAFTRAHCHARAEQVLMQARLVALQIVSLPAGLRLLSLNNPSGFVSSHPSFAEALIYAQAYGIGDEWADALHNNYVVNSDIVYLQDFMVKFEVTAALISKVASRYKMDTTKPPTAAIYMKKLLRLVKDIPVAYQLASDLGLHDLSMELIQIDNGSYLRDVVEI